MCIFNAKRSHFTYLPIKQTPAKHTPSFLCTEQAARVVHVAVRFNNKLINATIGDNMERMNCAKLLEHNDHLQWNEKNQTFRTTWLSVCLSVSFVVAAVWHSFSSYWRWYVFVHRRTSAKQQKKITKYVSVRETNTNDNDDDNNDDDSDSGDDKIIWRNQNKNKKISFYIRTKWKYTPTFTIQSKSAQQN